MKKGLLTTFLLALFGLAGSSLTVMAQTPEPTAKWTFENPSDLMAPSTGSLQMIPAVTGNKSITFTTVSGASIISAEGPTEDNKAIYVPQASALKVARAEGAQASQSYTLMMDIMMPDANNWNGLFQTDEGNTTDGDLFTHSHQIGIASLGGYFGNIKDDKWYRVVLSYKDGKNILYVNGEKLVSANPDANDRFLIQPFGFYLFCDESGEMVDTYVSEVAFWETPLTDEQVSELGGTIPLGEKVVVEIATAQDLYDFAQAVESGANVDGLLTADIDLSTSDYPNMMIGTEANPFTGTFDGQGHTITYSYDFSANYCGLFSYISSATIKNLRVEGDVVTRGIHYGALIGYGDGTMLVENVVTNVNITGERGGVTGNGGMIGALYGDITFNNCATHGEMGYPGSSMYCGFVAFATSGVTSYLNNCYTTCKLTEGTGTSYCFTFCRGTYILNNCYYLNVTGDVQGIQITEEQIESGSLCYKLNGDQSEVVWTQAIGTDEFPAPNPAGQRVYASGTVRCDGAELEDNPLTYSNTESYPVKPDHNYGMDGICSVCGQPDPNAVTQDENGFYLIGNPEQLYWLYLKVNESDATLKVRLTDDIDLNDGANPSLMIGTEARPFTGIFDGAGHTIHYDYDEVTDKWRGLFAFVKDATIRNLRVEGTAYVTNIHYGALIGKGEGTILVENVITDVDITGAMHQVTGDAGMIGANYADITFNNCATLGEMGFEGSSMYSPFSGWSHGDSFTTLNNCFSTCKLTEGTGTSNCFTLTHQSGTVVINNSYYLHVLGKVLTGENIHQSQITEEQLANGELCYLLNGDQSDIHWYQIIDDDEMPVLDDSHLRVYGAAGVYMNVTDETSFRNFKSAVLDAENDRLTEPAQAILIDNYLTALDHLAEAANIDDYIAGFNALQDQRDAIQSCTEAYAAYWSKVVETLTYLDNNPDLANIKVDQLREYLTGWDEPDENYPNGSAAYILNFMLLSEEEIIAETALIDAWLTEAISYQPAIGTDVSVLFTNLDLSDQFNGWEGQLPTGWGGSETSPLYAAECLVTTMDMYQTVTGLPNGIYELKINGAFRPTPYNNFYNVNYAATLYANDIHNFFQANIEDMIPADEAIDGENCNINGPIADFAIEDLDGNLLGYTMQGIVSCCNAFQAGRYPNSVLCNVTDGQLTIGVCQPGTGLTRDWLGFGNIKVYYYGQLNEAGEALDEVLSSQSDRAKTILDTYEQSISVEDYATYPNYSQALKNELRQTLNAVATTTDPAAKYQLIEKFSELFLKIYECKQAYVKLLDMAFELNNMLEAFEDFLTEDEFSDLDDLFLDLCAGYENGTMSAEEVLAINISDYFNFLPEQDSDGNYLLATPKDFAIFAHLVNSGNTQVNAKLVADINLIESDYPDEMIGVFTDSQAENEGLGFAGVFDGQGHTITYDYTNVEDKWRGLFAIVNNATIRNLCVEGSAYVTNIHYGALIGRADGNVLVEKVITNVNITGARPGVTGDAGMVGANYAHMTFNNCATLGEMGYEGSSMYSPFSGWSNGSSSTTLNNCYSTCKLTEGTGTGNCFTLTHQSGTVTINNCYYLHALGKVLTGSRIHQTQITEEQLASGELCYKLNATQAEPVWFQTIGEDAYPVLNESHGIVILGEDGIYTGINKIEQQTTVNGQHTIYNLAGQRLSKMQKGINIVNRKKILVK